MLQFSNSSHKYFSHIRKELYRCGDCKLNCTDKLICLMSMRKTHCLPGSGSCTNRPLTLQSRFILSISSSNSSWETELGRTTVSLEIPREREHTHITHTPCSKCCRAHVSYITLIVFMRNMLIHVYVQYVSMHA